MAHVYASDYLRAASEREGGLIGMIRRHAAECQESDDGVGPVGGR